MEVRLVSRGSVFASSPAELLRELRLMQEAEKEEQRLRRPLGARARARLHSQRDPTRSPRPRARGALRRRPP